MRVGYGSCAVSISAGYVAIVGLRVWLYGRSMGRWMCPLSGVTFEPGHVLLWAWQEVKGEAA